MTLTRQRNSDTAIAVWAERRRGALHAYGSCDCLTLAVDAISVQTGVDRDDLLADVRPYRTKLGALRAAIEAGGFKRFFVNIGLVAAPSRYAQAGDIGVVEEPRQAGTALVCVGAGKWLGVDDGGEVWIERAAAPESVFRVA